MTADKVHVMARLDPELWRTVKQQMAGEDLSWQQLIEAAVQAYADGRFNPRKDH